MRWGRPGIRAQSNVVTKGQMHKWSSTHQWSNAGIKGHTTIGPSGTENGPYSTENGRNSAEKGQIVAENGRNSEENGQLSAENGRNSTGLHAAT